MKWSTVLTPELTKYVRNYAAKLINCYGGPKGTLEADNIVSQVIWKTLEGFEASTKGKVKRKVGELTFDPSKVTLKKHLLDAIKKDIHNFSQLAGTKKVGYIVELEEYDEEICGLSNSDPLQETIENRFKQEIIDAARKDPNPISVELVKLVVEKGIEEPREQALCLGVDVKEITNAKKRLRRVLAEIMNKDE